MPGLEADLQVGENDHDQLNEIENKIDEITAVIYGINEAEFKEIKKSSILLGA